MERPPPDANSFRWKKFLKERWGCSQKELKDLTTIDQFKQLDKQKSDAAAPGEAGISAGSSTLSAGSSTLSAGSSTLSAGSSTLSTGSSTLSAESDNPKVAHFPPEERSFEHSVSVPMLPSSLGRRAICARGDTEAMDSCATQQLEESEKQELKAELKSGLTADQKKRRRMSSGHAKRKEQRAEKEANELAEVLKCSLDFKAVQIAYEGLWAVIEQFSATVSASDSDKTKLNTGHVELNATLARIQEAALHRHATVRRKMVTVQKLDSEVAQLRKRESTMKKQLKQGEQRQRQQNSALDAMNDQIRVLRERDSSAGGKCVDTTGDGQVITIQILTEFAKQHRIMRLWTSVVLQEAAAAKEEAFNHQLENAQEAKIRLEQELEEARQQLQKLTCKSEDERIDARNHAASVGNKLAKAETDLEQAKQQIDMLRNILTSATTEKRLLNEQLVTAADSGQLNDELMRKLQKKRGKLEDATAASRTTTMQYAALLLELEEVRLQNEELQVENQRLNKSILIFAVANEKADAVVAENRQKRLTVEADLELTKQKEAGTVAELAAVVEESNEKEAELKALKAQAAKLDQDNVAILNARELFEKQKRLEIEQLEVNHACVKQEFKQLAMKAKRNDDVELSTLDTNERRGCCGWL